MVTSTAKDRDVEYYRVGVCGCSVRKVFWVRRLLEEIGSGCEKATTLWVDNQSAIKLSKNPEFHIRIKHIDIEYHYVREKVASRQIEVKYIPTELQRADMFTKALPRAQFNKFCDLLLITSIQTVSVLGELVFILVSPAPVCAAMIVFSLRCGRAL